MFLLHLTFSVLDQQLVPHYGGIVQATPMHLGCHVPYNKKLVTHVVAVPATRTPRSVIWAELDRINHRPRPHLSYLPKEDFLNDHAIVHFDDEARIIRAQTNSLLRRINTPAHRPARPLPISLAPSYNRPELSVAERITSDDYIHRMVEPTHNVPYNISVLSYYPGVDPVPTRMNIGKGHLACVTYAGGRAYPRRRERYSDNKNIKDEINIRSYYRALDKPELSSELEKWKVPHMDYHHGRDLRKYKMTISAPLTDSVSLYILLYSARSHLPGFKGGENIKMPYPPRGLPLTMPKASKEDDDALKKKRAAEKEAAAKEWAKEQEIIAKEKKQAEEAKKAEEAKIEAAKRAEEERIAEEARKAEEAKLAEKAKKAEEARLAEEAKIAEEKRKEEEKKKEEEEARKADEAKKAEEARLAEEAKKAEEARLAEEARKAEEVRLAEEARLAEEEKKKAEEREAKEKEEEEAKNAVEEAVTDGADGTTEEASATVEENGPVPEEPLVSEEVLPVTEAADEEPKKDEENESIPPPADDESEIKEVETKVETPVEAPSADSEPIVEEPATPEVQNTEVPTSPEEVTSEEE